MTKLASVRATRLYGPEHIKYELELANAVIYFVATLLGVVGILFFLPGWTAPIGIWCLVVALTLFFCVNVHDLYAQLAGFDFRLPLVTLDPQLALIEIFAPLVQAIGGLLILAGFILFLRISWGAFDPVEEVKVANRAYGLLIAGSAFWLLGSILNASQVYENTDTRVQFMQKTVSVPLLVANSLFLVAAILSYETSNLPKSAGKAAEVAIWIAIAAAALLVFAAIMNVIRILEMREVDDMGGLLEPLRGGAQRELERKRREDEAWLVRGKQGADPGADVEEGTSYEDVVLRAEHLNP